MIAALITSLVLTLPVKVDGEGYLRFVREGRIVYAMSATLTVRNGALVSGDYPVTPTIKVPADAVRLEVDLSGNIVAVSSAAKSNCGQLVLARFDGPLKQDRGFFVSANRAVLGNPGEGLFGVIRSTNSAAITPAPASTGVVGPSAVVVQAVSEIAADQVLLKDVATITAPDAQTRGALENLVYGNTPPIGIDSPVTAYRIQALLKRAGIAAEVQAPSGAVVRRKYQAIPADDFTAAAIKAAQEKIGAEIPMTCSDSNQTEFKAPLGAIELKVESVSNSGMTANVVVAVVVEGRRINSRTVSLKVDASAQVKANAPVKVILKSAGVTVEVPGKTRSAGMVGQTITVVTDTGSVLSGIVIGPDRVEVKL